MTEPVVTSSNALESFPDLEDAAMTLIETGFGLGAVDGRLRVAQETPTDFAGLLPFVRVEVVDAGDDRITSHAAVDVEVFGATRAEAKGLAEAIRARFLGYPHRVGSVVFDRVWTETAPQRLPWDDDNIRRYGATYRISARR